MAGQQKIDEMEIYTVCEVAGILRTSDNVVYKEINLKKLKSKRVGNGRGMHRILGEWLLEYLKK